MTLACRVGDGVSEIQGSWQGRAGPLRCRHPAPYDLIILLNILYYFPATEREEFLRKLRSLLAPQGVIAIAMPVQGRGKDLAAANLNMVNCSLNGLTPLPDLDDLLNLLKEAGFSHIRVQRLNPGSAFCGISAANS